MPQRQLSHLNGRNLEAAKFKPHILCISLRLVLWYEHIHSRDFVWLLFVACTILTYNRRHTEDWQPCANRGPLYTLENLNFQLCEERCLVGAAVLRGRCLPLIPRRGKHKSLLIRSMPYSSSLSACLFVA
jgi:hypothetical protein